MANWKLRKNIYIVSNNSRLEFPSLDLRALINTMCSEGYEDYYRHELDIVDDDRHFLIFMKFANGTELFLFEVVIPRENAMGYIRYNYNQNYHIDCILLKWLCDLLGDKRYIYPKKKEEEEDYGL